MIQILPITDLRTRTTDYLEQVKENPIVVTKHGRPCAVLLDYVQYQMLIERLEDLEDLQDMQDAEVEYRKTGGRDLEVVIRELENSDDVSD